MKRNVSIRGRPLPPTYLVAVVGLLAALVWAYGPTLREMAKAWSHEPEYSHGWLVPVFAAALLWLRREYLARLDFRPTWWGLAFIALGLAMRAVGILTSLDYADGASLLPILAGLLLLAGGGPALRWAWPSVAFLIFMVPLPWRVKVALAHPLQQLAATVTTYVMQTIGLPALAEGNKILVYDHEIEVAAACSGLNMLVTFFALSTAVAILSRRPIGDRLVIFLSAVPIAVATNVIRIIVTALFMVGVSPELGQQFFHDWAGYIMPLVALGLLGLELKLLSWILIEPEKLSAPPVAGVKDRVASVAGSRRRGAPVPAR
jgi:exosortase